MNSMLNLSEVYPEREKYVSGMRDYLSELKCIDCNTCRNTVPVESNQTSKKEPHICSVYNQRCYHKSSNPSAYFIYPCGECVADGYSKYVSSLERRVSDVNTDTKTEDLFRSSGTEST